MALKKEILEFCATTLGVADFDDFCVNGLQVDGKDEVKKIVLGVSVSERFLTEAINAEADMILVHHGLFWKNSPNPMHITGLFYRRLKILMENNVSLAGFHLPLDAHSDLGNNAQIIQKLGMTLGAAVEVGYMGHLPQKEPFDVFVSRVNELLETSAQVFPYGPAEVKDVLVLSGGSSGAYPMALAHGADTFLCGDVRENFVREFEEVGLNFINAGHYNTEKLGIQALGQLLENTFEVGVEFIDIPNPV